MKKGEEQAEEAEKKKDEGRVAGTKPSHPIADYAGTYHDPGYGTLEIAVADADANALEMTLNGMKAPLEHWHYDVWHGGENDENPLFWNQKFLFRGDFDGRISEVVSPLELTGAPIVFEKEPDARLSDPDYLERFAGVYEDATGQRARIAVSGERLTLSLPGQPTYDLVPEVSGRFDIEGLQGFSIGFKEKDGTVTKLVFHQPNGVFESERVEE